MDESEIEETFIHTYECMHYIIKLVVLNRNRGEIENGKKTFVFDTGLMSGPMEIGSGACRLVRKVSSHKKIQVDRA